MEESDVHPEKVDLPISVNPSGRWTEESDVHPEKAHSPISVNPSGRWMKESDVPALKAIPYKLREDLRLEVYMPVLACHAFFEELFNRISN